jgi:hypothetical protein
MGNMLTARIVITGVRPLLWHAFGPDSIPLEKREKSGVAGNDPTEWKRTVLRTSTNELYLPGGYLFGCLREGATFTKRGRGTLLTALTSTLRIRTDQIVLSGLSLPETLTTDPSQPVYLDVRSVKNPVTKGRNIRYRVAAASGWTLAAEIAWDKTVISRGEMEAIGIDAGRLVGIGSGRKIGFGRFSVESFVVTEGA